MKRFPFSFSNKSMPRKNYWQFSSSIPASSQWSCYIECCEEAPQDWSWSLRPRWQDPLLDHGPQSSGWSHTTPQTDKLCQSETEKKQGWILNNYVYLTYLHCLQDMQHACGWHRASHWCCPWQPWHNQLQLLPEHLLSKLGVDTHSQSTTYYELSTIQSLASQKQILRSQLTVKHVTPCTLYNYQVSQIHNTEENVSCLKLYHTWTYLVEKMTVPAPMTPDWKYWLYGSIFDSLACRNI